MVAAGPAEWAVFWTAVVVVLVVDIAVARAGGRAQTVRSAAAWSGVWIGLCYPGKKLYVIMDNLHQTHDHPRFLALLKRLRIHPVWTPTEASWLNLIEAHFGALKRFTLANTDDPSHAVRRRRVYRYLRYRHRKLGTQEHRLTGIRGLSVNKLEPH
ncbi:MAG: transposase [Terriglobales bacterium]